MADYDPKQLLPGLTAVIQDAEHTDLGLPGKYRKEVLRSGLWNGVNISPENLAWLSEQFRAMRGAGIRIPLPMEHIDESLPFEVRKKLIAQSNKGWVEDIERVGDKLYAVLSVEDQTVNPDTLDTSVNIEKTWGPQGGKTWESVITHIALTAYPVVPLNPSFERLAASVVQPHDTKLHLTIKGVAMSTDGPDVKPESKPEEPKTSELYDALVTKHAALQAEHDALKMSLDTKTKEHEALLAEHNALKAAHDALLAEVKEVSDGYLKFQEEEAKKPQPAALSVPSPVEMQLRQERLLDHLSWAGEQGRLDPYSRKKIEALIRAQVQPAAFSVTTPVLEEIVNTLCGLNPLDMTPKTRAQAETLKDRLQASVTEQIAKNASPDLYAPENAHLLDQVMSLKLTKEEAEAIIRSRS